METPQKKLYNLKKSPIHSNDILIKEIFYDCLFYKKMSVHRFKKKPSSIFMPNKLHIT